MGIMSGTSLDGIEAAAIRFQDATLHPPGGSPRESQGIARPTVTLLAHRHTDFAAELRARALALASGDKTGTADVALLHAALGDAYADAALAVMADVPERPELIALHGQTVAHLPGRGATLQLGDASRVAVRTGVTTIADFRSADVAAGGQGAPLVPFADHLLFADGTPRVLLNLGGIANLTLLPTARREDVIAFDTGPGNMVLDALAATAGEAFDRDGTAAARGRVDEPALAWALSHSYFERGAPKSTGREEFGAPFAAALLAHVRATGGDLDDALATAVALTARSITAALERETPHGVRWEEFVAAGGGTFNPELMSALSRALRPLSGRRLDALGIPAEAREAVAFAILGIYRLRGEPNTLPRCTGARRATSGGAIYAP